jgi:hypothetical protein
MVGLLALAADGQEAALAIELERLCDRQELPNLDRLRQQFAPRQGDVPHVAVVLPSLATYDALLEPAS